MSKKIITLEITEKEYENYLKYCKLFNTSCEEDLIEYLKARSQEVENYISNNKKTDKHAQVKEKNNKKQTKKSSQNSTNEKYIYPKGNHYNIQKSINGFGFSFGTYKTLEEAIERRDFLIKENWDEKYAVHRKK